jgi:SRSO17 transposase
MRMDETACPCRAEDTLAVTTAQTVDRVLDLVRRQVRRPEAARHVADYLRGLLAEVDRKNGWQLAEHAGYTHPRGMQRVLDRYAWDADAVRDDLRAYVVTTLGDPTGILVIDETGFPKQGTHSVGVARQYCGTLGKIGNCQIGVFLSYAGPQGHAAIDRALYVPHAWLDDPVRCRQAGMPPDLAFQTKPQLAWAMLEQALDAGIPAAWVVADEVYGSDGALRRALEGRGQAYVLAVRGNQPLSLWPPYGPPAQTTVSAMAATVSAEGWSRLSCGEGAQGPRVYEWAYVPLRPALNDGWGHSLLIRRHPLRPAETAWYLVYAPVDAALDEMVRAAGTRWTIEEVFKLAKGQVGLDHYEVRSWQGWHRHITLALLALAALATAAKKGESAVPAISPSRSPNSGGSWSASSGAPSLLRTGSVPGPVGVGTTSGSPRNLIAAVA